MNKPDTFSIFKKIDHRQPFLIAEVKAPKGIYAYAYSPSNDRFVIATLGMLLSYEIVRDKDDKFLVHPLSAYSFIESTTEVEKVVFESESEFYIITKKNNKLDYTITSTHLKLKNIKENVPEEIINFDYDFDEMLLAS